jgi:hypothetical protein
MSNRHNARFVANPQQYLSEVTVLTVGSKFEGFNANNAQERIYMNLVPLNGGTNATLVRADFSRAAKGRGTEIEASFVPYVMYGEIAAKRAQLPALELPAAGKPKFVFTGSMNGCSLVVATKGGKKWVIHYPNSDGAVQGFPWLAQNSYIREKSVDYFDLGDQRLPFQGSYGYALADGNTVEARTAASKRAGNDTGWFNTFSFAFYDDSKWKLIAQPQFVWLEGSSFKAKTTGKIVEV